MLRPHKHDPNRKAELARQAENPAGFGYTGPQSLPAKLTPEQAAALADGSAQAKALTSKERKELEALRAGQDEAEQAIAAAGQNYLVAATTAALLALGEDFGADGKPDAARISDVAGQEVGAEVRDAVWARIEELRGRAEKSAGGPAAGAKGGK